MMLRRSKIGWCDYSGGDLNFIIGCTPISEGCANCYAAAWAKRCGRDFSKITTYWDKLDRLLKAKWDPGDRPYRRGPGSKPIMFPVDLGDLFHLGGDVEIVMAALDYFTVRDDADWVLLTKRPEAMLSITDYWLSFYEIEKLPDNIWCLVTAENQQRADERVAILLQIKTQMRGVSMEPMLGPIDLFNVDGEIASSLPERSMLYPANLLDWVICGAESGPDRRPFEAAWALDVHEQCRAAGVPFFGKQDSGLRPGVPLLLEGREVKEWPKIDANQIL